MIDCLGETVKLCNMLPGTQSKLTETTGNKQLFLGNICSNRSQKDSDRCVIFFFFLKQDDAIPITDEVLLLDERLILNAASHFMTDVVHWKFQNIRG